jgi:hypothetical protein
MYAFAHPKGRNASVRRLRTVKRRRRQPYVETSNETKL